MYETSLITYCLCISFSIELLLKQDMNYLIYQSAGV